MGVKRARMSPRRKLLLARLTLLLLALPVSALAEEPEPAETAETVQITEITVDALPIEMRIRRSRWLGWSASFTLLLSGSALLNEFDGLRIYETQLGWYLGLPAIATGLSLGALSQAGQGLAQHGLVRVKPKLLWVGAATLVAGAVFGLDQLWIRKNREVGLTLLGVSQVLGVLALQLQGFQYRDHLRHPKELEEEQPEPEARRLEWVPLVLPTRGGATVGLGAWF